MTIVSKQPVHYAAARSGAAPATFAQRHMFAKLGGIEPDTWGLNILQVVPVPDGLTVVEVREAIHDLVLRHETLRTRFRSEPDGTVWQYLSPHGEIGCEVWEIAGEDPDVVGPLAEQALERTNFDLVAEAPCKALVGTLHGVPTVVMVVTSHIATDMLSARLVRQDLADLLSARCKKESAPQLPARRQPLDQTAFESAISPAATSRLLASWRKRMTTAPPSMLGIRPEPPAPHEFQCAELTSTAMSLAADTLGRRYELTTSAVVVMAAEAVLFAHYAGADSAALQTAVGNRISPDLIWSTGVIRQHSLAVIDVRGATFEQVVRRTWSAWMHAQRHGVFNPDAIDKVRAEVQAQRGVSLSLGTYFNDLRIQTRPRAEAPAARILAAAENTRFAWAEEYPADYMDFQLRFEDVGAATRMSALVDTGAVPRDRVRELLVGMERLLIWQATAGSAAEGPLTPERLAVITGMSVFEPPPGWVRIEGSWVDLAAAAELLALATAGAPSTVRESDGRLVGYVTGPFTPEQLHERCVTALTSGAVRTPQHYVVCAPGDGDWADRPVLVEGSGRT
jgi:Condensation domain